MNPRIWISFGHVRRHSDVGIDFSLVVFREVRLGIGEPTQRTFGLTAQAHREHFLVFDEDQKGRILHARGNRYIHDNKSGNKPV